MNPIIRNTILMICMLAAAMLAIYIRPTHRIADEAPKIILNQIIPAQFGEWKELPEQPALIINPQQEETLQRIYTQTLSRTYVNTKGDGIMLSIAYGDDQSDAKQLHHPEVCYPAQGFQVLSTQLGVLNTKFGNIRVKRIFTAMNDRSEPLTYWTTIGKQIVRGDTETKLAQLRYAFHGQIPDGLLFRVSNISNDKQQAYALQQQFVQALLSSVNTATRTTLIGLPGK